MCMGHKGRTLNSECNYGAKGREPVIGNEETIVYDEEGRCCPQVNGTGGTDYHHAHYRVFKEQYGGYRFAVKHGGGEESFEMFAHNRIVEMMKPMTSDERFLMLNAFFYERRKAASEAMREEYEKWYKAAAEKRIKTRKMPGRDAVKVWIEPVKIKEAA